MKGFILLILGVIVALLVVGGAVANNVLNEIGIDVSDIDSNSIDKITDKVSNIVSSHDSSSKSGDGDDSNSIIDDIVSEEVKFNAQNGEGYYREVTYKDGGFRQYDTESGELIGSSYESDQDKLPSME